MDVHIELESVRVRLRCQLAAQPDTSTWDETSLDRLWLVAELTRALRISHNGKRPSTNGKYPPVEYTGESCTFCGSMNMRRTGSCSTCENCGSSGGCA